MPNEKDFTVGTVGHMEDKVPGAIRATALGGSPISKKPSYLITFEPTGAKAKVLRFVAIDKPDCQPGYVQAKGVFVEEKEDEIINNVSGILTSIKKELVLEVMFPWHRICSIRSLVFNAVKTQTLPR